MVLNFDWPNIPGWRVLPARADISHFLQHDLEAQHELCKLAAAAAAAAGEPISTPSTGRHYTSKKSKIFDLTSLQNNKLTSFSQISATSYKIYMHVVGALLIRICHLPQAVSENTELHSSGVGWISQYLSGWQQQTPMLVVSLEPKESCATT